MNRPIVSVVLGTYNRLPFLKDTVASIRNSQLDASHEIIVIDGGSKDGTIDWLVKQRDIITILQHNREIIGNVARRKRSWGYFMNLGFKCAQGKYLCLVSDDAVIYPDSLANAVRQFERELDAGRKLGGLAFFWRSWPEEERYRVGTTLSDKLFVNHGLFLRDAVANVGFIDEHRYEFYCADGDLSLKLWDAGYEVAACEDAFLEHFENAGVALREANLQYVGEDWARYTERWSGKFFDAQNPVPGGWICSEKDCTRDPDRAFPGWAGRVRRRRNAIALKRTAMAALRKFGRLLH